MEHSNPAAGAASGNSTERDLQSLRDRGTVYGSTSTPSTAFGFSPLREAKAKRAAALLDALLEAGASD